ncbi:hypothetical protein GYA89_25855 [Rhodococcus qingshengii]|nr:hypothetical protein [Rhodococcus qingshengii]
MRPLLEDFDADDYMPEEKGFKSAKTWAKQREYKRRIYREFREMHELASNGTYSPTWDQWQAASDKARREQAERRRANAHTRGKAGQ